MPEQNVVGVVALQRERVDVAAPEPGPGRLPGPGRSGVEDERQDPQRREAERRDRHSRFIEDLEDRREVDAAEA